jgi:hypothetical protein
MRVSCFFHHLTQEDYLLLDHMGLDSLRSLPFDHRQGRLDRQDQVLLQLEMVWSRKEHAWLGIP